MKTIRHNTFETNSSSTHSLTIRTTSPDVESDDGDLVMDNVLYPANLRKLEDRRTNTNTYGSESTWCLVANTTARKAALLVHQIWNFFTDEFYEEWCKDTRARIVEVIRQECSYADIVLPDTFYAYYDVDNHSDIDVPYEFPMYDFLGRALNDKPIVDMNGLRDYLHTHILNPDITIFDTQESY